MTPIGHIRSPFRSPTGMPIQPCGAKGVRATVVIEEAYAPGLCDLEGFSHIILIYHFHRSSGYALKVTPFLDSSPRGLFATRAPRRPNPIGISVVRLVQVQDNVLTVENIDLLDGTPLLDIKPYVPAFDAPEQVRIGWMRDKAHAGHEAVSDDRFEA